MATRFGRYAILEHLGEGGMCHVFRARRDDTNYDCALKVLKDEQRHDPRMMDLFLTESDVALLLKHPNLIEAYEAAEAQSRHYIAMELVEGCDLGQFIRRFQEDRLALPPDIAMFVMSEVLAGLQALHMAKGKGGRELGLVHRDLTPHNVFLSFDGRVLLGDFGVAHIQAHGAIEPGQMIGKIGYLAPEMVAGEPVDRRADIFGAGVLLFELLTRRHLFDGASDDAIMADIAEAKVPRPTRFHPDLSADLEAVVTRALARRPGQRFDSAREMGQELRPCWSETIGNAACVSSLLAGFYPERYTAWCERHQL